MTCRGSYLPLAPMCRAVHVPVPERFMRQPIASPLLMTLNLLNVEGLAFRLSSLDVILMAFNDSLRVLADWGWSGCAFQPSDWRALVTGNSIRKFYATALH